MEYEFNNKEMTKKTEWADIVFRAIKNPNTVAECRCVRVRRHERMRLIRRRKNVDGISQIVEFK